MYRTNSLTPHKAYASTDNNSTISLGNPFFVEKGKIIGQRVLSVTPQPQLGFTFEANGTINNITDFTNIGTTVSNLQANGVFHSKGQGFIMTEEGEASNVDQLGCRIVLPKRGMFYPMKLDFGAHLQQAMLRL